MTPLVGFFTQDDDSFLEKTLQQWRAIDGVDDYEFRGSYESASYHRARLIQIDEELQ